jgi:hypothetical protein
MHEHKFPEAPDAGWRERAERVAGPLELYASPTLCASEIGEFAYCPQAWFLGRCNIPLDEQARHQLEAGTRAHRRIGRRTDTLRTTEQVRMALLVVMAALAIACAAVAMKGGL